MAIDLAQPPFFELTTREARLEWLTRDEECQ